MLMSICNSKMLW